MSIPARVILAALLAALLGGCPTQDDTNGNTNTNGNTGTNGSDGSDGPAGPAGQAGSPGATGATGPAGPAGAAGPQGPVGPAGPVDSSAPAAPTALWVANSPEALPPYYELRWLPGDSSVPVQYYLIYESDIDITSAADELIRDIVPGPADRGVVSIFVGSGIRFFRVSAVSYTGVEGPLSPQYAVDSTQRVLFSSDRVVDDMFATYVAAPGANEEPFAISGSIVTGGAVFVRRWAPHARSVLMFGDIETDEQAELFVVRADGGGSRLKLNGPLVSGGNVATAGWSPDGTTIYYVADENADEVNELFVVPADGSAAAQSISGSLVVGGDVTFAEWSPDGTRIAFFADKELDGVLRLYVVPADGSAAPLPVSEAPDAGVAVGPGNLRRFWSPAGDALLYSRREGNIASIRVARADGSGTYALTDDENVVFTPSAFWSPDGTRVAVAGELDSNGVTELYVVPADGSEPPAKLSGEMVAGGELSTSTNLFPWSPDGARLAFIADKLTDGDSELFVSDGAGGTEPRRVSDPASPSLSDAAWSPTGEHLLYYALDEIVVADPDAVGGAFVAVSGAFVAGGGLWGPCCFSWNADGSGVYFAADKIVMDQVEVFLAGLTAGNEPMLVSGTPPLATTDSVQTTADFSPIGVGSR